MTRVTPHNPASLFPPYAAYAHAVEVPAGARTLYVSGLNGYEADGRTLPSDFEGQARLAWRHLGAALAAAAMTYADLVQLRFDLACRTVVVQQLLEPAWRIEVEAVAAKVD